MRINCPLCGLRDLSEFSYHGDAKQAKKRPSNGGLDIAKRKPTEKEMAVWVDYVYLRDNVAGKHDEIWQHGAGCRQFLQITRDTRNHEIFAIKQYENSLGFSGGDAKGDSGGDNAASADKKPKKGKAT